MAKTKTGGKPKQPDLIPGRSIPSIEAAAQAYVEIRDQRMALTPKEVEAHDRLLKTMKRHKKTEYENALLVIKVVVEKEKAKVRMKKIEEPE